MSLLANVNQPSTGQYYFALDSTPVDPVVTAPRYEAIGDLSSGGTFTALSDDTTGAGAGVFQIKSKITGYAQWSIGLDGIPAGAETGNNLAIFAYDDGGMFRSAPLQIIRDTGAIETVDSLTIGNGLSTTGSLLQVNGLSGLGRVYDPIYNRPLAGAETLISTYGPTGVAGPLTVFTAPNTGLYTLTMEVKADANGGFAWTNGVNNILGYLQNPFPPFDLLSDAFLACDSVANPTGMVLPVPGGAVQNDAYVKDMVAIVNLVGGTTYSAQANFNPAAFNLGTTGGVRFFIQPLLA